jgi:DNA-binding MarR family transcriptional regulator
MLGKVSAVAGNTFGEHAKAAVPAMVQANARPVRDFVVPKRERRTNANDLAPRRPGMTPPNVIEVDNMSCRLSCCADQDPLMQPNQVSEFEEFFRELHAVIHSLRVMGDVIHREDTLTFPERAMLIGLQSMGPRTISDLARIRLVSRQHVQVTARRLERAGWICCIKNPGHRKSHLLDLTPMGRTRLHAMRKREDAAFAALELPFRDGELSKLTRQLERVRKTIAMAMPETPNENQENENGCDK